MYSLAVYLPGSGLVLTQVAVESKETEIVAALNLVQSIDLQGVIVISYSMHTQRRISIQIVQVGGQNNWYT